MQQDDGDDPNVAPQPRRTQATRRAATERRLLDAAASLIAARGSHAVSIADVGQAAGYSRGIVTHQFGNKAGLLEAVVLHSQQFDVPGAGTGSGLTQLGGLVAAYVKNLGAQEPTGQAFLMMWTEALGADPVLAPLYDERDMGFRELIAEIVRTGVNDHSIRSDIDPDNIALIILGLLRGVGLQFMSGSVSQPDLEALATQTVAFIADGTATRNID